MINENCEPRIRFTAQRRRQGFALILPCLHVFLAHPHLGVGGERSETEGASIFFSPTPTWGWVASGARRKGASIFFLPTPTWGVGGERSETEGGISAMVNDGGCPFMFDRTLSFDRVLMPASQTSTALRPPSTTSWSPSPCKQGEASFGERSPPPPASGGRQGFGNVVHLTAPQA